jgi:hypothetical protein
LSARVAPPARPPTRRARIVARIASVPPGDQIVGSPHVRLKGGPRGSTFFAKSSHRHAGRAQVESKIIEIAWWKFRKAPLPLAHKRDVEFSVCR